MKMKRSNLVWGIICLVIAGGLTVANLSLPSEDLMFQIGDKNMPWVPPVVLAVIGVIILATSTQGEEKMESEAKVQTNVDPQKAALNKRMETVAWGCFLIMLGGFMFVPHSLVKSGWWSIGVGVIMLGLNAARYFYQIKMSGFTTILGILSVIGGVVQLFAFNNLEGAFLLIILGAYLIFKQWFDKRRLFGKAEEA
jgi:hypothetical protein